MIKLGIYNIKQLSNKNLDNFFTRRQVIALDLYAQLQSFETHKQDYLSGKILKQFTTKDGVFKYTSSNRFDAFDKECLSLINDNFKTTEDLKVHDMGASDGRSIIPFFLAMNDSYGKHLNYLASDFLPYVFAVRKSKKKHIRLILDSNGNLLQFIAPPFVLNMLQKENVFLYPINHLSRFILLSLFVKPILELYSKFPDKLYVEKVNLINFKCQELLDKHDNFNFEQCDILKPLTGKYNVIRVMNLLNRSYFSDEDLKKAVHNVFEALDEGGLFIAGSNAGSGVPVNGGVYKKENNKMISLYSSAKGLLIDDIIMNL